MNPRKYSYCKLDWFFDWTQLDPFNVRVQNQTWRLVWLMEDPRLRVWHAVIVSIFVFTPLLRCSSFCCASSELYQFGRKRPFGFVFAGGSRDRHECAKFTRTYHLQAHSGQRGMSNGGRLGLIPIWNSAKWCEWCSMAMPRQRPFSHRNEKHMSFHQPGYIGYDLYQEHFFFWNVVFKNGPRWPGLNAFCLA